MLGFGFSPDQTAVGKWHCSGSASRVLVSKAKGSWTILLDSKDLKLLKLGWPHFLCSTHILHPPFRVFLKVDITPTLSGSHASVFPLTPSYSKIRPPALNPSSFSRKESKLGNYFNREVRHILIYNHRWLAYPCSLLFYRTICSLCDFYSTWVLGMYWFNHVIKPAASFTTQASCQKE